MNRAYERNKQMNLESAAQNIRNAKDARFAVIDTESAVELLEAYDKQCVLIADFERALLANKDAVIQNSARKVGMEEILKKAKALLANAVDGERVSIAAIREIVQIADKGAHL